MDVCDAVEEVAGYTHRKPPSDEEMARLRRLAREADDPHVRAILSDSLSDLQTLREIDAALAAAQK